MIWLNRVWQAAIAVCTRVILGTVACCGAAQATDSLLLQSTTSTANSGLYDYLLPHYRERSGIQVHVVAVGTGQAIRNAGNCDGDVLLVHAKAAEQQFVADGYGVERYDLMYNDFVLIGPADDPAELQGSANITDALAAIASRNAVFTSRGDNSGTHKKELQLWSLASIDAQGASGTWYRETGSGMGATLNITIGMNAYTLTDRATWLNFKNRQSHRILFEGDERLFNQYGVILVNPDRCPRTKADAGQDFINWLTGEDGQRLIAGYKLNGEQLFYPNAQ